MKWLKLFLLLLASLTLAAQQYPSTHYTDKDALSNNTVRTLFKAADGALWIGTDNGLVRKFNGQIDTFFKEDGLTQNNSWAIAQDQTGRLWIGSYGNGLTVFQDKKFKAFSGNNALPNLEITKLLVHDNALYVGTSNGVAVIDLLNPDLSSVLSDNPTDGEKFIVQDFLVIGETVYAISYANGIHKIELSKKEIQLKRIWAEKYLYAAHTSKDSVYLSGKEYYKKTPIERFDQSNSLKQMKPFGNSIIWDYQQVNDQLYGAAWGIYTNTGGVYEMTSNGMKLRNKEFGITSSQVTSLAYDKDLDLLYAGTLDNGFFEVRLDEKVLFFPSTYEKIIGFAAINNKIARLYNHGLTIDSLKIDAVNFKQIQVDYVKNHPNALPKYSNNFYELDYKTPAAEIVFYTVKSHKDSFWVNTSIGLYQFRTNGKLIAYMPVHALNFDFTSNGQLIEPNFYHGTRIYESIDPLRYTYYDEKVNEQNPRFIVGSLQQGNKTYLTSIFNGLYAFEDGQFTSHVTNEVWNEKRLRFVTNYGDSKIAVSNEDGEVFIIDDRAKNFSVLKINRNRINGSTITFLTSYKETLIIGTAKGVVLYTNGKEIFLDEEQGVKGDIYTGFVRDDLLFLGSDRGSYQLKLLDILGQNNRVKTIDIKSIYVNGKELNWKSDERLLLKADQNSLDFQIGTNIHPYPNKLIYNYRLDNDKSWIPMTNEHLQLQQLSPGFYNLAIQVIDSSTGMSVEQQVLDFRVATPFYKSFWFAALCFLVATGFVALFFRSRRKREQRHSKEQAAITKRMEEVKMEALLSQMNPHFVFNSLNSVQYLISNAENDKAMRYLGTFSDLMRANLNNTAKPFLSLEEEIEYLKKYMVLENARFSDRIKVTIKIDPELSLSQTMVPTMMLQPFVENVFIHAFPSRVESPELEISFDRDDEDFYKCTIKDNGIGGASFAKNKRHVSKGTQLVEERLSFLGYTVSETLDINYAATGAIVTLRLKR